MNHKIMSPSLKIAVVVPARSEALFDRNSKEVFGGGNIQMYLRGTHETRVSIQM